jgi:hypothetical protein
MAFPTVIALDPAWAGVIGALGGVLLTSLVAIATALLNHSWETDDRRIARSERLAEERVAARRTAYASYIAASDTLIDALMFSHEAAPPELAVEDFTIARLRGMRAGADEVMDRFISAEAESRLLAGEDVLAAIESHSEWVNKQGAKAVSAPDPAKSKAFHGKDKVLRTLQDAMRSELQADLDGG